MTERTLRTKKKAVMWVKTVGEAQNHSLLSSIIKKPRKRLKFSFCEAFGRDEATRTPDPYVPNVVRYQLRYIPIPALSSISL